MAVLLVLGCVPYPAVAQGLRPAADSLRVDMTASERRERIRVLLLARGVDSPLLAVPVAAPRAVAEPPRVVLVPAGEPPAAKGQVGRLLDLIGAAEAGRAGYDAIHHRATRLPDLPPTALTLGAILDWIDDTPDQPHAIGRYQIIPSTLRYLVSAERLSLDSVFSPALQDRLALRLLADAGLAEFLAGQMPTAEFMDSLAFVWAGLPLASGLSAYDGIAGNAATITRREYEDSIADIFGAQVPPVLVASR